MQKSRKKFVSIVCIVLVAVLIGSLLFSALGSAMAVTQSEIDALKSQQATLEQQKKDLKTKIGGLETQKATVVEKKTALDEQNEVARQEIEIIDEQIALYDELIQKKAVELEKAKEDEEAQKKALRVRMRAMEENGDISYFAILFESKGFSDLLSRLDDVSEIMKHDNALEDAYIAARERVEKVKAEYEATQAEQESTRAELQQKKAELEGQIATAVELIAGLESDIEKAKAEDSANAAREAAVRSQIDQKVAELERQQQEQINAGGSVTTGSGNFTWPTPSCTSVGSGFGYRTHPIFGDKRFHSGVDIGASHGATIVAADSGTVVSAVYSSSYGNYVVISHGNGNSTLYAHMSSMAVSAGQTVSKGDTIGYVGSTGWSTGAHLHFKIKIGGTLVDPMSQF
ncbi:MAG: peptidoglycan DD-metalloendopeptidase family protein [Oscillospiraceae bacterium]